MGYLFVFVETLHIWFLGISRRMEEQESEESVYDSGTNFNGISGYQSVFNNNCFVNVYVLAKRKHKKDLGKYKSHFEMEVAEKLGSENYEVSELEYEVPATPHHYTPDFTLEYPTREPVYIECKGRPRTTEEMKKYLYIRECNQGIDLRFIIMSKDTLMPRSKKTTLYEWLVKHNFTVYVYPNLPNFKKL